MSPTTFAIILPPNPRSKKSTNSQKDPETLDKKNNSEVCTIKILLDSSVSVSIVHKDVLYARHSILIDNKNKWSTMAGTFNTTFVTEIISKLQELNYSAKIYALRHMTDKY